MSILDQLEAGRTTSSMEETMAAAEVFARYFPENETLKLSGSLGAGKTTFVKGLARGWGIRDVVTSPTYNLYSIYRGVRQLIHFDAYRITEPREAAELLIEEFLEPPFCLAIEWPENSGNWLAPGGWQIHFSIGPDQKRHLRLTIDTDK
ncbi:MAG: tRNA (adenosine(37)-N6)-threonylcarbamoyltransferase complex ATPase subunit type 1 TsaE [Opitutae bacterium]|nr:tRNA (adenosine(37)-N6)-threonylcarbamoyltransferase complex ATPase subunit type 1 TsaE [Opitutae bacterium]